MQPFPRQIMTMQNFYPNRLLTEKFARLSPFWAMGAYFSIILCASSVITTSGLVAYQALHMLPLAPEITLAAIFTCLCISYGRTRERTTHMQLQDAISRWKGATRMPNTSPQTPHTLTQLFDELHCLTETAIETHYLQSQLKTQLAIQQKKLGEYENTRPLKGELNQLFIHIQEYAQLLEDALQQEHSGSSLRDAFDEISEHCMNLQLLTQGIERLQSPYIRSNIATLNPQHVMENMLPSLAAALERRNMALSTLRWKQCPPARICANGLEHLLWLILLGAIRYAEDESTLSLSCEQDSATGKARITCLITELAPAHMLAAERIAFMQARHKHQDAHMFAHTLSQNVNYVLARNLAQQTQASLQVHPRTETSCMVELLLPV